MAIGSEIILVGFRGPCVCTYWSKVCHGLQYHMLFTRFSPIFDTYRVLYANL